MLNSLRLLLSSSLGLGFASVLRTAPQPLPFFPLRLPRVRYSKTYGAMPFDAQERAEWNARVRASNRAKGKKHV
jgi:hypothetical protein